MTDNQRNANQNHSEISFHTCQNGYHQKDNKWKMLLSMWRKGSPCAPLVGKEVGAAILENRGGFLKFKIELWHDTAIPLLGINPNKREIIIWKDTSTPICIAALSTIAKIWNQPVSTNRWTDEADMAWNITQLEHRMKVYHLQQHGWIWKPLCLMKTEKDKYCMFSLTCGI